MDSRELVIPLNTELNYSLRTIENQPNPSNLGDRAISQPPLLIEAHNQFKVENLLENVLRMQPPALPPRDHYRGNVNIRDSDIPLVLPSLPQGHTFVVTIVFMQMLNARGLFVGMPSEDPYAHICKLRSVCKSCVGSLDMDMNVIGLRVFSLSLIGDAAICFTELPYNSIYTLD